MPINVAWAGSVSMVDGRAPAIGKLAEIRLFAGEIGLFRHNLTSGPASWVIGGFKADFVDTRFST